MSHPNETSPPPPYAGTPKKEQPQLHPGMSVTPNAPREPPVQSLEGREWTYGLFDCFGDCKTCCLSCWCPCIAYSKISMRHEYLASHGVPHPTNGGSACPPSARCVLFSLMALNFCSTCAFVFPLRSAIRARYNIRGDDSEDCLSSWCCTPCALTQTSRELRIEEAGSSELAEVV